MENKKVTLEQPSLYKMFPRVSVFLSARKYLECIKLGYDKYILDPMESSWNDFILSMYLTEEEIRIFREKVLSSAQEKFYCLQIVPGMAFESLN